MSDNHDKPADSTGSNDSNDKPNDKSSLENFNMREFLKNKPRIATVTDDLDNKIKAMGLLVMGMLSELQKMGGYGTERPVKIEISPAIGMVVYETLNDLIGMRNKLKPLAKTDDISPLVLMLQLVELSLIQKGKPEPEGKESPDADGPTKAEIDEALRRLESQ